MYLLFNKSHTVSQMIAEKYGDLPETYSSLSLNTRQFDTIPSRERTLGNICFKSI